MCENSQNVSSSHFLIRSVDRLDYWETTPSKFRVNLTKALKGSKAMISYAQIPSTYYNITPTNNVFNYGLGLLTNVQIIVPVGSYTLNDLINTIQTLLVALPNISVNFNTITNLITISSSVNFSLNFNVNNSISSVLGFSPNLVYSNSLGFTGLFVPKIYDNAIYIGCNFCAHMQNTSKLPNVSFIIPHNCNKNEIIQFYAATQFQLNPKVLDQVIGYLEFTVYNEKGEILQGLADWCMMIQII